MFTNLCFVYTVQQAVDVISPPEIIMAAKIMQAAHTVRYLRVVIFSSNKLNIP